MPPNEQTQLGRFLSNTYDHRNPDAEQIHCYSFEAMMDSRCRREEWQRHLRWINENVVGPPKGTSCYTQTQLEEMGMIGIYAQL